MTESSPGPILIAYDGSDCAQEAIAEAGRQLHDDRPAIVLTIWEPLDAVPFWGVPLAAVSTDLTDEVTARARAVAEEGVGLATTAGFEASAEVELGAPVWKRIVDVAKQRDASIIVLGSQGRSSVGYAVMGSVATAVAHHAKAPVMITRAPEH